MGLNILISGGGIAGLAAANFLHRGGHSVSVIDKAHAFQKLGYVLSLKGFGLKILGELGLREELEGRALLQRKVSFYEPSGRLLKTYTSEFYQRALQGSALTLRTELHEVLYRAVKEQVPVQFGLQVTGVEQGGQGEPVQVGLSNGESRKVDLLIVAEGMRSPTREAVFSEVPNRGMEPIGVVYAAGRVATEHGLDTSGMHTFLGTGRLVALMPVSPSELLVQAAFRDGASPLEPPRFSKEKLLEVYRSFSPKVTRQIEAVTTGGYVFFDAVAMVKLPQLSRGRVVFLGDAAHSTSFMSGMGASLGLLGSKVLAGALAEGSIASALARYAEVMTPVVRHYQRTAQLNAETMLTESRPRVVVRDSLLHLLPAPLMAQLWARQFNVEGRLLRGIV